MAKSILNTTKYVCYRCGVYGYTERHHLMGGTANRKKSEEDGLWLYLCPRCHNQPPEGAHFNKQTMNWLHKIGQEAWEGDQIQKGLSPAEAREKFMKRYGKNYL